MSNDSILCVDYHDENCVIRRFDEATGKHVVQAVPTEAKQLLAVVSQAEQVAKAGGGQVVWIQESTTGWARMQALLARRVKFQLVNILQLPLPPKARRQKTDKIDTARMLREYRNGGLPLAFRPPAWWRQVRRLVAYRENLVSRQTALRNWIGRYLAHETWAERRNLWSGKGRRRLRQVVETLPNWDRLVVTSKLREFDQVEHERVLVEKEMLQLCQRWPRAQRLDAIAGLAQIAAVSIAARIGPIGRFEDAEHLIAYAGLAPGIRQSDGTRHNVGLGGGGTDRHLRHYLIEATVWARKIPRYRQAYDRVCQRRGKKIGRITVARMLLRSIYRMLRKGEAFAGSPRERVMA
jgi:transposase